MSRTDTIFPYTRLFRSAGHQRGESAEPAHVARACLVIDDPGVHEQRGLERGVVHYVEHAYDRRRPRAETEQHGQKAQMAARRIGEDRPQIMLAERDRDRRSVVTETGESVRGVLGG